MAKGKNYNKTYQNRVTVSKKHGVNPTILKCYWCGKDKGVAMLGKLPGDIEAPKYMTADIEPCEECQKEWKEAQDKGGIIIFEVTEDPKRRMSDLSDVQIDNLIELHKEEGVPDGRIFTGALIGLKEDVFDKAIAPSIKNPEIIKTAHERKILYMDDRIFQEKFKDMLEANKTEEGNKNEDTQGST